MQKSDFELVVCEGKRSIAEIILASVFLGVFVFLVAMTLYSALSGDTLGFIDALFRTFMTGLTSLAMGLKWAVVKTVLIDLDKDVLISRYHLGPFSYDVKSAIPELEYVSVFLDSKGWYRVNLWYKGNKHYKMYFFEEKATAMELARYAAIRLNIDLLDATDGANRQWIDLGLVAAQEPVIA